MAINKKTSTRKINIDSLANRRLLLEGKVEPTTLKLLVEYYFSNGANIHSLINNNGITRVELLYKGILIPLEFNEFKVSHQSYACLNSDISKNLTVDKYAMGSALSAYEILTPEQQLYENETQLREFLKVHKIFVIKPNKGSNGHGVAVVDKLKEASNAVLNALKFDNKALLQEYVSGDDYRLLFVDFELVAAIRRIKPYVVGDGVQTIRQLILRENKRRFDIARRLGLKSWRKHRISQISMEQVLHTHGENFLRKVPAIHEQQVVLPVANISTGALCEDVTSRVDSKLTSQLEGFLKSQGLGLCGVDVLSQNINTASKHKVIELNSSPGFLPHEKPDFGDPQPVGMHVAEALYRRWKLLHETDK